MEFLKIKTEMKKPPLPRREEAAMQTL